MAKKIKELMTPNPTYISPEITLHEAAKKMRDLDVGFLPVGKDKLLGIITDRDIVIQGLARGLDPKSTPVRDVMTDKVWYCFENNSVKEAADSMERLQIRRLIVLNNEKDKRFTGVISLGDIATKTHDEKLCGEIIEAVSQEAA